MTKRNSPVVHITREEFQALIREEDERLKVRAEDVLKLRRSRDCIFSEDGSAVLLRISTPWDKEFGAYIVLDSPDLEIVIKLNISGRLVGYKRLRAYLSGTGSQSLEKLLLGIDDPEVRTGHFNGIYVLDSRFFDSALLSLFVEIFRALGGLALDSGR